MCSWLEIVKTYMCTIFHFFVVCFWELKQMSVNRSCNSTDPSRAEFSNLLPNSRKFHLKMRFWLDMVKTSKCAIFQIFRYLRLGVEQLDFNRWRNYTEHIRAEFSNFITKSQKFHLKMRFWLEIVKTSKCTVSHFSIICFCELKQMSLNRSWISIDHSRAEFSNFVT